jgi:type VI secretion system secreted protein Hcp
VGWIELQSFQWSVARGGTATARASSRQAQGTLSSMSITKVIDKASPVLRSASAEGKHFKTVILEFISRAKAEHYQITLTDVLVSSVREGDTGARPVESVTLNFAKFEAKYGKLDAQGNRLPLQAVPAGWDVRLATPTS